jgi:hypothetical protein
MIKEDTAKIETEKFVDDFVNAATNSQAAPVVEEGAQGVQAAPVIEEGAQGVQAAPVNYQDLYQKEVQRTKSWEGRLSAEASKNKELQKRIDELSNRAAQDTTISLEELIKSDPEIQTFVAEMGDEFIKPLTKMLQVTARKLINDAVKPIQDTVIPIHEKISSDEVAAAKKHYTSILNEHKDALELLKKGSLNTWIESLPYKQALDKQRILQDGETQEVIDLLTEYKQTLIPGAQGNKGPQATRTAQRTQAEIAAATAVKSGPASLPKGLTKAEDFVGAFEEATQTT